MIDDIITIIVAIIFILSFMYMRFYSYDDDMNDNEGSAM